MTYCSPEGVPAVLIVDDEPAMLEANARTLRMAGIEPVIACSDPRKALGLMETHDVGAVVLDLGMPHLPGEELLVLIGERFPGVPVLVMTGNAQIDTAVACMKSGAVDYLVKPVEPERFCSAVRRAREARAMQRESIAIQRALFQTQQQVDPAFSEIVTQSSDMYARFRFLGVVARTSHPILITGEAGTGKRLIADAVHRISGRPGRMTEFVTGVCAGDEARFTEALLGRLKGAYTATEERQEGDLARAGEGTLYVDEIGEIPRALQKSMLGVFKNGRYYPSGSDEVAVCRARIIVASTRDLGAAQREGHFRLDLLRRLEAYQIHVPPLRERAGDIPLLLRHFVERISLELGRPAPLLPTALYQLLGGYAFPGNIGELEGMVRVALMDHGVGTLSMRTFKTWIQVHTGEAHAISEGGPPVWLPQRLPTLKEMRRILITAALERYGGNQKLAAGALGVTHQAVSAQCAKLKLKVASTPRRHDDEQ